MNNRTFTRLNVTFVVTICAAYFFGTHRMQAQANANPPALMTYQGYLVDANGNALGTNAPKNYDVIFRIWDVASGGVTPLWGEQQTVTVDKGYFSVLLGEGSSIGDARPALNTLFTNNTASDRWVGITVKGIGPGGADANILPRLRLLTSPYAFLAHKAVSVDGSAVNSGTVADGRLSSNVALRNGGNTFTGDQLFTAGNLAMDNSRILYAKNFLGSYEPCFWPRWSDNVMYMNFGVGGFNIRNNSSTSVMFMQNGGNVGIGTTSPAYPLDVNGIGRFSGGVQVGSGISAGLYGDGGNIALRTFSGGAIYFQTFNGSSTPMYISPAGNVGIGTFSPSRKLQVGDAGVDGSEGMIRLASRSSTGGGQVRTWDIGVPQTGAVTSGKGYSFVIDDINLGTDPEFMIRWDTGFVGIGTTAPPVPLTVQNASDPRIRVQTASGSYADFGRTTGGVNSQGRLYLQLNNSHWAAGNQMAIYDGDNNWDFASDRRFKKDIEDAEPMLDRAMNVEVRRYRWKDADPESRHMLGVIAQEVQPLFPDLVSEFEDPNTHEKSLSVGYGDFALIAVKSLQEFKKQYDDETAQLKARLAELARQNELLQAENKNNDDRLAALEKLVIRNKTDGLQATNTRDGK